MNVDFPRSKLTAGSGYWKIRAPNSYFLYTLTFIYTQNNEVLSSENGQRGEEIH